MANDTKKKINELIRWLRGRGWTADQGRKHWKLRSPDGATVLSLPVTPSDYRTMHNVRRDFRRAGYPLPR
jgi:hypothetical protein